MAREVRVLLWCDPCLGEETQEPGEELTLGLPTVSNNHLKTLTLCERHRKEIYEPLAVALGEFGVRPESTPKSSAPKAPGAVPMSTRKSNTRGGGGFPCPVEGCDADLSTRNSLQGHVVRTHNRTLDQLDDDAPFPCGQADCGIAFKFPQHLALHLKKTHGVEYADTR